MLIICIINRLKGLLEPKEHLDWTKLAHAQLDLICILQNKTIIRLLRHTTKNNKFGPSPLVGLHGVRTGSNLCMHNYTIAPITRDHKWLSSVFIYRWDRGIRFCLRTDRWTYGQRRMAGRWTTGYRIKSTGHTKFHHSLSASQDQNQHKGEIIWYKTAFMRLT